MCLYADCSSDEPDVSCEIHSKYFQCCIKKNKQTDNRKKRYHH